MGFVGRKLTKEERERAWKIIQKDWGVKGECDLILRSAIDEEKGYILSLYGGCGTYEEERRDYDVFIYKNKACHVTYVCKEIEKMESHSDFLYKFYEVQIPKEYWGEKEEIIRLVKEGWKVICESGVKEALITGYLDEMIYDETELKFGEVTKWE